MLGWFLYFEMALFTASDNSLLSIRYEFSRIFKVLVALWQNWFISSDINRLSDITVSFSSARVILFVIFCFSEKKDRIVFQNSHIFLTNQDYWNTSCVAIIFLFRVPFWWFRCLFLKINFCKFDLFIMDFLKDLVTYGDMICLY